MAKKKEQNREMAAWLDFAALASFLLSEDAPLNINETPEDSKFFKPAKELAEELELDWKSLSQDDSNRIMINLLGDAFMNIQAGKDKSYVLHISVHEVDKKLKEKEKEAGDEAAEM